MGNIYIHRIRGGTDAENRIILKPGEILEKSHRVVRVLIIEFRQKSMCLWQRKCNWATQPILDHKWWAPRLSSWDLLVWIPTKPRSQSGTLNSHHGTWKGIHWDLQAWPSQILYILIRMCMNNIWLRAGESSLLHVMCFRNFWDERAL